MKLLARILTNSFYLLILQSGTLGALFVFGVLLARELGSEALGLYALFAAILMPFSFLVDLGQSTSLVPEIAKAPSGAQVLKDSILLKLVLVLLLTPLLYGFGELYFEDPAHRGLFGVYVLTLFPRALYSTFDSAFRAQQSMGYLAATGLIHGVLLLAGTVLLFESGYGFRHVVVLLVLLEAARAVVIWWVYQCTFDSPLQPRSGQSLRSLTSLARRSLPFFLIGVAGILYNRMDMILLAALQDASQVGVFAAASYFVRILKVLPSVMVASFFPAIAGMAEGSPQARAVTSRILLLQLSSSLVLSGTLFALSPWIVIHTFNIAEAVAVLQVLVWTLVPVSLYSTIIYFFFQSGRAALSAKIIGVALVVNLSLNYFLIPTLGAMALAVSSLASEFLSLALFYGFYLSRVPVRKSVPSYE